MSLETIASRYAQALLEIGVETRSLQPLSDQLTELAQAWATNPELRMVIENPLVGVSEREAVLDAIATRLGASPILKNTLRLLVQRRRMSILPQLARKLRSLSDEQAGLLRAEVSSAKPLPEEYVRRLQGELEKMTGRKVVLERKVDPALLSGVVTRVGDLVIDGSIRTRLGDLRAQLLAAR